MNSKPIIYVICLVGAYVGNPLHSLDDCKAVADKMFDIVERRMEEEE